MAFDAGLMPPRPRRTPYAPAQSLQFSAAHSQYLTRTPGVAGNAALWTFSAEVKLPVLGQTVTLLGGTPALSGSPYYAQGFQINTSGQFFAYSFTNATGYAWNRTSKRVMRDPTAFIRVTIHFDADNPTPANRLRVWYDDEELSWESQADSGPGGNWSSFRYVNTAGYYNLIAAYSSNGLHYGNLILTDAVMIDGALVSYSNLLAYSKVGDIVPKRPEIAAYGTNGFWLDGEMSGVTAFDKSGNGNHWTAVNGVTECLDSPGDKASADVGNYARLITYPSSSGSVAAIANAGLTSTATGTVSWARMTIPTTITSGKYYFEVMIDLNLSPAWGGHPALFIYGTGVGCSEFGSDNNTRIGVAVDTAAGKFWWRKNGGAWVGAGDPVAGTLPSGGPGPGIPFRTEVLHTNQSTTSKSTHRFDPSSWTDECPAGFKPLCTAHLPAKTPKNPRAQIGVKLYTGTGAALTQGVSGLGFQPDFVWVKNRSAAYNNVIFDSVRGAGNRLVSNSTGAEDTGDGSGVVSAFDVDGFSVDGQGSGENVNYLGHNYVGWCIGGLTHMTGPEIAALVAASSDPGAIIPTGLAADTDIGFSIVRWTGRGIHGDYLPHGLGMKPALIIGKRTDQPGNWVVYHSDLPYNYALLLNSTAAPYTTWDLLAVNSTFAMVANHNVNSYMNALGGTYVAYCFANTDAIKVGSYTGNGSADGPFVDLGGVPLWEIIKRMDSAGNWCVFDTTRNAENPVDSYLYAESSTYEGLGNFAQDFVASGVKHRNTNSQTNASGATYIYLAFIDRYFGGANVAQGRAR